MKKYIIYSPSFDENIGGVIALHRLCDLLNSLGNKAYLWPANKPLLKISNSYSLFKYYKKAIKKGGYKTFCKFNTPIATENDLKDSIVVYPELVNGNPLDSANVVRWFLHKPGFHSGEINYGQNELYFFYQPSFNDESINPDGDNLLNVSFLRTDIYKQKNFNKRSGSCYILRKGKDRKIQHDLTNSKLIDGLSHEEIADIFNSVEYCYSYDGYTMYTSYAIFCGCKVIYIPEDGVDELEWQPKAEYRYGISYGVNNIKKAELTKDLLLPYLKKEEKESNKSVLKFVIKCENFFKGKK